MKGIILLTAAFAVAPSAHALNKCVAPDGKVTYSDMQCDRSAKKAELSRSSTVSANSQITASQTSGAVDAEKKFKELQASGRERAIPDELERVDREIQGYRTQMDAELAQLRAKKQQANNNLAGATWEQSISAEMQAVTNNYNGKIKVAGDRAQALRDELAALRSAK